MEARIEFEIELSLVLPVTPFKACNKLVICRKLENRFLGSIPAFIIFAVPSDNYAFFFFDVERFRSVWNVWLETYQGVIRGDNL